MVYVRNDGVSTGITEFSVGCWFSHKKWQKPTKDAILHKTIEKVVDWNRTYVGNMTMKLLILLTSLFRCFFEF
jgi:hypothetical protein